MAYMAPVMTDDDCVTHSIARPSVLSIKHCYHLFKNRSICGDPKRLEKHYHNSL